jgi:hypothetical protein
MHFPTRETHQRNADNRRIPMKTLIAMSAAAALLAGVTIASAQTSSTPGAGSAGQDQRGGDMEKTPGTPKVKDAPPSTATSGAATRQGPKVPYETDKSAVHQSGGDRDSRGTPKQ